jgi:hypothetical protein
VKKNVTALALAIAGMTAQDAFATISNSAIAVGAQIQIGCTAPSATGATVYSIDNTAQNAGVVSDTMALPSGVSAGASCSYAINQFAAQTGVTSTVGRWVAAGASGSTANGSTAVNVTIPGSGYSLQTYTFVAQ